MGNPRVIVAKFDECDYRVFKMPYCLVMPNLVDVNMQPDTSYEFLDDAMLYASRQYGHLLEYRDVSEYHFKQSLKSIRRSIMRDLRKKPYLDGVHRGETDNVIKINKPAITITIQRTDEAEE